MIIKIKLILLFIISLSSFSHSGGTIRDGDLKGCHHNLKSQSFHCHSKSSLTLRNKKFISKQEALSQIKHDSSITSKVVKYDRKLFKHWIDEDRNCLNTRAEILKQRSLEEVIIKDCNVKKGLWRDYYYNESLLLASSIDIDHIVPLKVAWESGAKNWTSNKRKDFANDSENLVITNLKYNRQKGARTPLEWLPINKEYACKYIGQWIYIKEKYELTISSSLIAQFREMNCR